MSAALEKPSPTMLQVLRRAASRPTGYICPTPGLRGRAQTAVVRALIARGLIEREPNADGTDSLIWRISTAGYLAIEQANARGE